MPIHPANSNNTKPAAENSKTTTQQSDTIRYFRNCRYVRTEYGPTDNGWCRMRFTVNEKDFIAVGIPSVKLDPTVPYQMIGNWEKTKYGPSLKLDSICPEQPGNIKQLQNFFKQIRGIGKVRSQRIIDTLGPDALNKIRSNPRVLLKVEGIYKGLLPFISKQVIDAMNMPDFPALMMLGISSKMASKILNRGIAIQEILDDPFILMYKKVPGYGYRRCKTIADNIGLDPEGLICARGYVYDRVDKSSNAGHCFVSSSEFIDVNPEAFKSLCDSEFICEENGRVFIPKLYFAEKSAAAILSQRLSKESPNVEPTNHGIYDLLDDSQKQAVNTILNSRISILTGGPGTGKTFTLNAVRENLHHQNVCYAAFTGKAAARINESLGITDAKTIHSLLHIGYKSKDENEEEDSRSSSDGARIDADWVIIDEASMVDAELFSKLLINTDAHTRLLFVGDVNQLESIGPGSVLGDMIASGAVPVARLQRIHRQNSNQNGGIPDLADDILNGKIKHGYNHADIFRLPEEDREDYILKAVQYVMNKNNFKREDVMVLTPIHGGPCGTIAVNNKLQDFFNPLTNDHPGISGPKEMKVKCTRHVKNNTAYDLSFRVGDPVINLKNDSMTGIRNGDIGTVTGIEYDDNQPLLRVQFTDSEGKPIIVPFGADDARDQLDLAYCITVHKSQGSEYPCVIALASKDAAIMMSRRLVYTAVTRAKKHVTILTDPIALNAAIARPPAVRNTMLGRRLKEFAGGEMEVSRSSSFQEAKTPVNSQADFKGPFDLNDDTPQTAEPVNVPFKNIQSEKLFDLNEPVPAKNTGFSQQRSRLAKPFPDIKESSNSQKSRVSDYLY